jgi:hypothetical protein
MPLVYENHPGKSGEDAIGSPGVAGGGSGQNPARWRPGSVGRGGEDVKELTHDRFVGLVGGEGWPAGLIAAQPGGGAASNGAGGVQGGGSSTRKAQGGRPLYRRRSPRQGPHDEGLGACGSVRRRRRSTPRYGLPGDSGRGTSGCATSCRVMASGRCVASGNAASGSAPALGVRAGARTPREHGARGRGAVRCGSKRGCVPMIDRFFLKNFE